MTPEASERRDLCFVQALLLGALSIIDPSLRLQLKVVTSSLLSSLVWIFDKIEEEKSYAKSRSL